MRIGIDASRANVAQRTGTEWYAFHLTKAVLPLLAQDTVTLYVREPLRPEWGTLPPNVQVRVLRWWPGVLWTQLRLSWELLVHRVDVLFVPAHTIPFLAPKRTVTTLHDIGFEHVQQLYGTARLGPRGLGGHMLNLIVRLFTMGHYGANEYDYHRFSARQALEKCQTILTVSEYSKQDICQTYGINPERVVVIPNAYDQQAFNPNRRTETARFEVLREELHVQQPYLMAIGRIEKKKNTLGFVEAFARLHLQDAFKQYTLLLVGKPGLGSEEGDRAIVAQHLEASVVRAGWVSADDVPVLLAHAAAFILPSLFEGFGIPVLEAMAVGTPVACSNTTALPEVAGQAAELFDPTKPASIAEALARVLGSPARQAQLRARGYERAKQFSWATSARKLSAILHQ